MSIRRFIHNKMRKYGIWKGRRNLTKQCEEMAIHYKNDPELTIFSCLDREPFHDYDD